MKFYMAPMEGMTGYVFRNAYQKYFGDVDKYFMPFLSSVGFNHKELSDVLPEHNQGMLVVPQILTNKAEDFLKMSERLKEFGYDTVNLNLGCPSGTVVSKGRGAGFLKDPAALEVFLDEIFTKCSLKISVKTRVGVQDTGEWTRLLEIYHRFPMEELIVHPRVQKDFYKHPVRRECFRQALTQSSAAVCYNGDLHSVEDFAEFVRAFPETDYVMLGRGLFKYPGLAGACKRRLRQDMEVVSVQSGETKEGNNDGKELLTDEWFLALRGMLSELLDNYRIEMGNDTHTLYKMKEIWTYLGQSIPNGQRALKGITKARSLSEYKIATREALKLWEDYLHN